MGKKIDWGSNNYSLEEQLVGTWIDGKPLYQKTVNCGGVVHDQWISANHNISNIAMVCAVTGGVINPDTGSINGPGTWGDNKQGLSVRADRTTVGGYLFYPSALNTWLLYVTFQYTKTTD